ncbi:MAG: FAD-binding oxidoreductase, partial [Eubacteriales bacterium]|nr:FAD-binding oxidoreductase [Eubacteriales bacterium]
MDKTFKQYLMADELISIVGKDNITDLDCDLDAYSLDVWWPARMWVDKGCVPPRPDVIVFPKTTEQISEVVKFANRNSIPIVPRGAGAGGLGGVLAIDGGIVIDMKKHMNKIIDLDEISYNVTAQAGIMQVDLETYLNDRGYTLNHFPASMYCSSLGGFLSCRGSGHFSSKYGKIENMLLSLEAVLPTGKIVSSLPVPVHSTGPSYEKLFLGAEGIYGIITQATLKINRLPEKMSFRALLFDSLHSALESARTIMVSGIKPAVVRIYDENDTKEMVKKVLGTDIDGGGYMVLGFEGFEEIVAAEQKVALRMCFDNGAQDLGEEPGWTWWKKRFNFYYPPYTLESSRSLYGVIDSCALHKDIENVYRGMKKAVEEGFKEWGVKYIAHFSHWYDWGASVYPNFIIENPPEDPQEGFELNNRILEAGLKAVLENGGVLNEHHGIGIQLAKYMRVQYGEAFDVLEM